MQKPLCYNTSRDYKRLKELLDKGYQVVCFVTYDFNENQKGREDYHESITTDICYGRCDDNSGWYHFCARGIEYAAYWSNMWRYKSFEEMCEKNSIEFIEPTVIKLATP